MKHEYFALTEAKCLFHKKNMSRKKTKLSTPLKEIVNLLCIIKMGFFLCLAFASTGLQDMAGNVWLPSINRGW